MIYEGRLGFQPRMVEAQVYTEKETNQKWTEMFELQETGLNLKKKGTKKRIKVETRLSGGVIEANGEWGPGSGSDYVGVLVFVPEKREKTGF